MVRVDAVGLPKAVIAFVNPVNAPQKLPFKNEYFKVIRVFHKTFLKLLKGKLFVARPDVGQCS